LASPLLRLRGNDSRVFLLGKGNDTRIFNIEIEYDKQRTEYLEGHNIKVIRITNHEIRSNLAGVLAFIVDTVNGMKATTPSLRDTPSKIRRGK